MIRSRFCVAFLLILCTGFADPGSVRAGDEPGGDQNEPRWWGEDAGPASVPFPYIYEPVDSWVYQEVERQVAQGNLTGLYHHSRLLPRALIAARVAIALKQGKRSVGLTRLARELAWEGRMMDLDFPFEDTRPWITLGPRGSLAKFNGLISLGGTFIRDQDPDYSDQTVVGLRGNYWSPSGFSLNGEYLVTQIRDAPRFGDPVVEGTEIQYWTPRFTAAWHGKFFEIWAGRDNLRFGPGRSGGLMVGGGADPFGQLGYRIHLGNFATATAVHGWLSQPEGRYVAYHRVEMNLGKGLRFGVGEGVRYDGTSPDILYLTNLVTYAAVERLLTAESESPLADRDSLIRSNVIAGADLYWNWGKGKAIYAELLVDDVKTTKGGVPTRLGYQLGTSMVSEGSRRLTLQAEYTRVYNFTYSVYYGRNYFHRGRSLGYPLGADVGDARLWVDLDLDVNWTINARAYHTRIGEGNNAGPWCPAGLQGAEPFDSECQTFTKASGRDFVGVVERTIGILAGVAYAPRDNVRFEIEGGAAFLNNPDHVDGEKRTRPIGRVLAAWRW